MANAPKDAPKPKDPAPKPAAQASKGPKRAPTLDGGGDQVPGTGERGKNPWN